MCSFTAVGPRCHRRRPRHRPQTRALHVSRLRATQSVEVAHSQDEDRRPERSPLSTPLLAGSLARPKGIPAVRRRAWPLCARGLSGWSRACCWGARRPVAKPAVSAASPSSPGLSSSPGTREPTSTTTSSPKRNATTSSRQAAAVPAARCAFAAVAAGGAITCPELHADLQPPHRALHRGQHGWQHFRRPE